MEHRTPTILLAEDDPQIMKFYISFLYRGLPGDAIYPLTATRAQEGLDLAGAYFTQNPKGALLLITDNKMPSRPGDVVRSGVELAHALKRVLGPRYVRVHACLVTGDVPLPQNEENCFKQIIGKPIQNPDLFITAYHELSAFMEKERT